MPQIKEDVLISEAYKKLYEIKSNLKADNIPFKKGDIIHIESLNYLVMVTIITNGEMFLSIIAVPDKKPEVRSFVYVVSDVSAMKKGSRGDIIDIEDTSYVILSKSITENKNKKDKERRYKVILRAAKLLGTMGGDSDNLDDMKLVKYD